MRIEKRLQGIRTKIAAILNDDTRYAIAERVRELGYIDFRDFFQSSPAPAHVLAVERILKPIKS